MKKSNWTVKSRSKSFIKKSFGVLGVDLKLSYRIIGKYSIYAALAGSGSLELVKRLRRIVPDISKQQESDKSSFDSYLELKRRGLHAFQCFLLLKSLEGFRKEKIRFVDIGDSAGTHICYLKDLIAGRFEIDATGVNLDPRAIEKIKSRGIKAILCRAEDLDLNGSEVDLFSSFEMLEHLHNPAIFLHRLAKKTKKSKLVITVPYLNKSRVGLHNIRNKTDNDISAENEHIFELSPKDWELLMLHSGWKVVFSKIYYQYPRHLPVLSRVIRSFWRMADFEGFWGAILEKDASFSERYKDWEK